MLRCLDMVLLHNLKDVKVKHECNDSHHIKEHQFNFYTGFSNCKEFCIDVNSNLTVTRSID